MKPALSQIKRQAQKKLLTLLRNKFPASQGDFFTAVEIANSILNNFFDEIADNECNLSPQQKNDYLQGLIPIFGSLKYKINSEELDIILKNHGEDFSTFPEISNPDLREKLSMNLITMSSVDISRISIEKIVENKELQTQCLWFYFSIKVKEILQALRLGNDHKLHDQQQKQENSSQAKSPFTTRTIEKRFLLVLNEDLNYLDSTPSGFKDISHLKGENEVLLEKTKKLKLGTIDEVSDNLLLLSLESAMGYLKRLFQDINNIISIFEERAFNFLKHQEGIFIEIEFQLQLQERPEIIEVLQYLNSRRLEMSKNLRKMIELRMELYQEIKNTENLQKKTAFTAKQCAYALDDIGFYDLPKIKYRPKTEVSNFVSALSGASAKNIKTGMEERHVRKGKNATPHQKKDTDFVDSWFSKNMRLE